MNNNCLFNAAFLGFFQGALSGSWFQNATAAQYDQLKTAAVAFATEVDSLIPFDATITTGPAGVNSTMLVSTASNTIQSNTLMKPMLLEGVCEAAMNGRYTIDSTPADYAGIATACALAYTRALAGLVSP